MKEEVEKILKKSKRPVTLDQIYTALNIITKDDQEEVLNILNEKVDGYDTIKTSKGYIDINKTTLKRGILHTFNDGHAEVRVYDTRYYINGDNLFGAIDGDDVLIDTVSLNGSMYGRKSMVRVSDIIDRSLNEVAGEIIRIGNNYFVKSANKKQEKLMIKLPNKDYIIGQRVVVSLDKMINNNTYDASIKKVLGHKDDPSTDILLEAYKYGIKYEFSKETKEELKTIPQKVTEVDKIGRMDLTKEEIFTIDGSDTKDIDDAVSIKLLENGNYQLGVHIADVTHYVKKGSSLYNDAKDRSTSSYLAGTVIPMLPHELSNGICSLNPNVDRLTLSCIMEYDKDANLVRYDINNSVINSNMQMTYEKVNDLLKKGNVDAGYKKYENSLKIMSVLAEKMKEKRLENGSIDSDVPELNIKLDDNDKAIGIYLKYHQTAENIIEEFMIKANECIARCMRDKNYISIYRVHESPYSERIDQLLELMELTGNEYPEEEFEIKSLFEFIKGRENMSNMLQNQLIRSLRIAYYSSKNNGHFGLASDCYTHFTSPIRRFPDIIIHYLIHENVLKDQNNNFKIDEIDSIARHSSEKEKQVQSCERDVIKMKVAEYMKNFIGNEYEATVIDMDDTGIYIQLKNLVEGKIKKRTLDGKYNYDDSTKTMISDEDENKENYYLGDLLNVKLIGASKETKLVTFAVNSKVRENTKAKEISQKKLSKSIKNRYI